MTFGPGKHSANALLVLFRLTSVFLIAALPRSETAAEVEVTASRVQATVQASAAAEANLDTVDQGSPQLHGAQRGKAHPKACAITLEPNPTRTQGLWDGT